MFKPACQAQIVFCGQLNLTYQKHQQQKRNTFRLSNSLDPDQDRHNVSPDLGCNCLHSKSAVQDLHCLSDKTYLAENCSTLIEFHLNFKNNTINIYHERPL